MKKLEVIEKYCIHSLGVTATALQRESILHMIPRKTTIPGLVQVLRYPLVTSDSCEFSKTGIKATATVTKTGEGPNIGNQKGTRLTTIAYIDKIVWQDGNKDSGGRHLQPPLD